jgi:hypothetical protein
MSKNLKQKFACIFGHFIFAQKFQASKPNTKFVCLNLHATAWARRDLYKTTRTS